MATKTKASIAANRARNNAAITAANTKAGASAAQQNSANASALASMNQVRTSQGLAPQAAIGVQAQGRTSGALTIDQATNEIKDATGAVVGKGSSPSDALAKQTQLSSGAAPTVAGRPDLFAVAPGANQEVRSFFDQSTQTTVTPKTATAEQMAAQQTGTLDSFNKAQGLTYLDGATFKDLQPNLNETDLIRGPNGQIWLKQGLTADQVRARAATSVTGTSTGVTGGTTASEFTVDVPDTITTDTITEMMETPVTETDFNNMLAGIQVKQAELLALMTPGADEQATKAQINDIKAQVEKSLTELSMGLNNVEDQPIAMQFITGQQASIQRSAEAKLQNLARIETNLLNELGLEQEARAVKASVAQTQLGYLQTNLDTAFKVKQMIQQEEDSVFNRARALKSDAQATFATILDTMKGIDEADMSADQQKQLQDMSIAAGIPYSLVVSGLNNMKHQLAVKNSSIGGGELLSPSEIKTLNEQGVAAVFGMTSGEAALLAARTLRENPPIDYSATETGQTVQSILDNLGASNLSAAKVDAIGTGVQRRLQNNDIAGAKNEIITAAISALPMEIQKQAYGRQGSIDDLKSIQTLLKQYEEKGGKSSDFAKEGGSWFSGIDEKTADVERKLLEVAGTTTNPEKSRIANDIALAMIDYRHSMSGAAFTESESKQYESIFPSVGNAPELNSAKIESLLSKYDRNQKSVLDIVLGGSYDEIMSPTFGDDYLRSQWDQENFSNDLSTSQNGSPLEIAESYLGMNAGDPKQAQTLSAFFKKAGGVDIDPATTAWCAAFLNSVLGASGIKGTGSLMAQSFLRFGTAVKAPTKGDIVVFERGEKGSGQGHVGIITAINKNGSLQVLGGNQSNRTSIETFKTSRVLGYRRITQAVARQQVASFDALS